MEFLISINSMGFDCIPEIMVQIIKYADASNAVDGIELNADVLCEFERAYMTRMARTLSENGMILQIHAPEPESHNEDNVKLAQMLGFYDGIASVMGTPSRVVFHPVSDSTEREAVERTAKYVDSIVEEIAKRNLAIIPSLENLNSTSGRTRLGTRQIAEIVKDGPMGLCWDIGHEVASGNHSYRLEKALESRIDNVHIHDVADTDHCPFYHFNTDFIRAMKYLRSLNYQNGVVLEINMAKLNSSSLFKKYHEYVGNLMMLKNHDNPWLIHDFAEKIGSSMQEVV